MLDVQAATDRRLGIFGGDDAVLLRAVLIRDDVYERLCCVIMQQCAVIAWILRDISRMFLRITFLRTTQIGSEIIMDPSRHFQNVSSYNISQNSSNRF